MMKLRRGSTPNVPFNYDDQQQNAICLGPNNVLHETTTECNLLGGMHTGEQLQYVTPI
jgi:hypothetical protein